MRVSDFDYDLPQELIAQHAAERGASRMLVLERSSGALSHRQIAGVVDVLAAGDRLLLNDTRVIPARLYARRSTGRRFEAPAPAPRRRGDVGGPPAAGRPGVAPPMGGQTDRARRP